MSDLDHITDADSEVIDNYAFKIVTGKVEIRFYGEGNVEGWPSEWTRGNQFLIINRIPALLAAAEQVGYALGYEQAKEDLSTDLSTKAYVVSEKLPR